MLRAGISFFDSEALLRLYSAIRAGLDEVSFGKLISFIEQRQDQEWAILCRTNARVEDISKRLHDQGITHSVALGSQRVVLDPWIARVFSDYTERLMGFKTFQQKLESLVINNAKEKWGGYLKTVEGRDDANTLDLRRLREGFTTGGYNIPDELNLVLKGRTLLFPQFIGLKGRNTTVFFGLKKWKQAVNRVQPIKMS